MTAIGFIGRVNIGSTLARLVIGAGYVVDQGVSASGYLAQCLPDFRRCWHMIMLSWALSSGNTGSGRSGSRRADIAQRGLSGGPSRAGPQA